MDRRSRWGSVVEGLRSAVASFALRVGSVCEESLSVDVVFDRACFSGNVCVELALSV